MTGAMLAFCVALLSAMTLSITLWQVPLVGIVLLPWLAARAPRSLTVAAAAGCLGLIVWQGALDRFRHGQAAWLTTDEPQVVLGSIASLPACDGERCRFLLRAESPRKGLLSISWRSAPKALEGGQRCTLLVKLRPHWSLLNPAGFDRESWAFSQSLLAAGQVQAGGCRRGYDTSARLLSLRDGLSSRLSRAVDGPAAALIPALVTGDRRALGTEHWRILSGTGTAHLMAISGLHVALVAGSGLLLARVLLASGCFRIPRSVFGAGLGMLLALGYATLAGWSVSTQRASLMLLAPLGACLLRRPWQPTVGLLWALTVILLIRPETAASRGLWMSFVAAAVLLAGFFGRTQRQAKASQLVLVQGMLLVGLWPLQQILGLPFSVGFLLINLVAVPWVSLLILPATLVGSVLHELGVSWVLTFAGWQLNLLWHWLAWVETWVQATPLGAGPIPPLLASLLAVGFLLPKTLPGWWMLPPALLLLWLSRGEPEFVEPELQVFDAGQGTAAFFGHRDKTTLIDTGPGASDGWNAGTAVIAPSLQHRGVTHLNQVIISHGDADHAGGLHGLQTSPIRIDSLIGVSPDRRWTPCLDGQSWRWPDLELRTWHPGPWLPYLGNDSSCVVTLRRGGRQIVFPGDVSELIEHRVLRRWTGDSHVTDLLLLGHHGSRTSSADDWLRTLRPSLTVATSGHHNRFDMPHPSVRRRLERHHIPLLVTAECGHLQFRWGSDGLNVVSAARLKSHHAWHWPGLCPEPGSP
ncbi:MAG: DNA internalization-related competence protein ComEC/Rec2 [Pseudomonadota bacterium]